MSNLYNFNVTQNSNFSVFVNAQNSDGTYINLSGYQVTGAAKFRYSDINYLCSLSPSIYNEVSGLIAISGNIGTGVPAGKYVYDIVIYTGNYYLQILNGYLNLLPSISIQV